LLNVTERLDSRLRENDGFSVLDAAQYAPII
jgi:hypothetical protein